MQLSSFKLRGKSPEQKTMIDLSVITTNSEKFESIKNSTSINNHAQYEEATCKIFDIIPDDHYKIRALCAVALGNDTNPGGINGIGPSTLAKEVSKLYADDGENLMENIHYNFLDWISEKLQSPDKVEAIKVYAESFLFEPGVPDDIRPLSEYYLDQDYITNSAPESSSHYNE